MRKPSIALLHYSVPPIIGGVEEVLRQHAELFHRHHHQVIVVAGEGGEFSRKYEIVFHPLLSSTSKAVQRAHSLSISKNDNSRIYSLSKRIYRFLRRVLSETDVLIAHNVVSMPFNLPLTLAVIRMADEGRLKVISWGHDSPYFYPEYPRYLEREPWNILKKPHPSIQYVAVTEARAEQFRKLYGIEVVPITNGVDPVSFFEFHHTTIRIFKELELSRADLIAIIPFRMVRRKNIELAIRVLAELKKRGIKARFLLTGKYDPHNPDSRKYHRELLALTKKLGVQKEFVILTDLRLAGGGMVVPDRRMLKELYQISDLVFLPSKQEGFGLPLLEAGLLKLPIVCSDIKPFREIGREDVLSFSLKDPPEKIAERLLDFLQEHPTSRMFRRVMREYEIDNIYFDRILPLLKKTVS